jgi:hypothetical protein
MMDGIGMMMRSMNILRAQEVRMKVRESMHLPPLTRLPSASLVSMAGLFHAYRTGVHCRMFTRVVLMP